MKNKQKIVDWLKIPKVYTTIILVLTIIALNIFVTKDGIVHGGDLEFHINRIYEISENLKSGDVLSLTYSQTEGYGSGIFYPQIFLYIPAILVLIGVDLVVSYKIFIIICNIANVLVTYICVKKLIQSRKIAIFTTVLYSTCCYRFAVTYWIAAIGTLESFVFVPIVVLGLYEIFYGDSKKWYILTIGITGLIYSHLLSFVIIVVFLCLPIFIINLRDIFREKERIKCFLYSIIFTILLTAAFVCGFLEQMIKYDFYLDTINANLDMSIYTVPFPFNIIGIYDNDYNEELECNVFGEMGVGLAIFVVSIMFFVLNKKQKIFDNEKNKFINKLFILATIYVLIISIEVIWKYVGIFNLIQFQFRLQLINSFVFSLIAACVLSLSFNKKYVKDIFALFLILEIVWNFCYVEKFLYNDNNIIKGINYLKNKGSGMEYIPAAIDYVQLNEVNDFPIANNNIENIFYKEGKEYVLKYDNNYYEDTIVKLPLYYYEGYEIVGNDNDCKITNSESGYLEVLVSGQEGEIKIKYEGTNILKIGYIVSIITYSGVFLIILLNKSQKAKNYKNVTKK